MIYVYTGSGFHPLCVQDLFASRRLSSCQECQKLDYAIFLSHFIFNAPEMPDGITYLPDFLDNSLVKKFWCKAVYQPNSNILRRLIKIGMQTTGIVYNGIPLELIELTAQLATPENFELLLDSGLSLSSDISQTLIKGFYSALVGSNFANATILLNRGVDINQLCSQFHRTPLSSMILLEKVASVKFLIDNKADLNLASPDDISPLHLAISNDNAEIIELLLRSNRANIKIFKNGRNLIQTAVYSGQLNALRALLDNYNHPDVFTKEGYSLLQYTIATGPLKSVEFLINRGFMPLTKDGIVSYALHLGIALSKFDINGIVGYLLQYGANIYEIMTPSTFYIICKWFPAYADRFARNDPPIVMAILKNNFEMFKAFLDAGMNPNTRIFRSSRSLLHLICELGNVEMAVHLISMGADAHALDSDNRSPFYYNDDTFLNAVFYDNRSN